MRRSTTVARVQRLTAGAEPDARQEPLAALVLKFRLPPVGHAVRDDLLRLVEGGEGDDRLHDGLRGTGLQSARVGTVQTVPRACSACGASSVSVGSFGSAAFGLYSVALGFQLVAADADVDRIQHRVLNALAGPAAADLLRDQFVAVAFEQQLEGELHAVGLQRHQLPTSGDDLAVRVALAHEPDRLGQHLIAARVQALQTLGGLAAIAALTDLVQLFAGHQAAHDQCHAALGGGGSRCARSA